MEEAQDEQQEEDEEEKSLNRYVVRSSFSTGNCTSQLVGGIKMYYITAQSMMLALYLVARQCNNK